MQTSPLFHLINSAHEANGKWFFKDALEWSQQALMLAPDSLEAWGYNLGVACKGLGRRR